MNRPFTSLICIVILTLITFGCKEKPSDIQPKKMLLAKEEAISPPQWAIWPYYNFSIPARRQYYTNYEYDDQARLIRIQTFKDNSAYAAYDNRPDDLIDSYVFTYDQTGKLSKLTQYTPFSNSTYLHRDAFFVWSDKRLNYTDYFPTTESNTPTLYNQYIFYLNDNGLPIRQTSLDGTLIATVTVDITGNILELTSSHTGHSIMEFDLNRLDPYSSSYSLTLWKNIFTHNGDLTTLGSRNWVLKRKYDVGGSVVPEKIIEANEQGYPTLTRIKIDPMGWPVLPTEDPTITTKYSYITK